MTAITAPCAVTGFHLLQAQLTRREDTPLPSRVRVFKNVTSFENEWRRVSVVTSAELLLHPVRLRIVQTFLGDRALTTSQLRAELPDVPPASVYRHVARRVDRGRAPAGIPGLRRRAHRRRRALPRPRRHRPVAGRGELQLGWHVARRRRTDGVRSRAAHGRPASPGQWPAPRAYPPHPRHRAASRQSC